MCKENYVLYEAKQKKENRMDTAKLLKQVDF